VGPSIAETTADGALPPGLNTSSFFPFATITCEAAFASFAASVFPSLRLAGTTSLGSIPCASRNLDAFVQLVQPLRW
jgi:hypothetical protein